MQCGMWKVPVHMQTHNYYIQTCNSRPLANQQLEKASPAHNSKVLIIAY